MHTGELIRMKRQIIVALLLILVVAMAVSLAGCKDKTPETSPAQTNTPSPGPTTSPGPVRPPDPAPPETLFIGKLALNEIYYMHGDVDVPMLIFLESGNFESPSIEGEYNIVGDDLVELIADGAVFDAMKVIDEYTLQSSNDETYFVRKGGDGFTYNIYPFNSSDVRVLFFEEIYYRSGIEEMPGFRFYFNGKVDIITPGSVTSGTYVLGGNTINIAIDGQLILELNVLDAATLEDELTGDFYSPKGAYEMELGINEKYYFNGNDSVYSEYMEFYENGEFLFDAPGRDNWTGTYTVEGDTVFAELDGDVTEIYLLNSFVLLFQEEFLLIKIP